MSKKPISDEDALRREDINLAVEVFRQANDLTCAIPPEVKAENIERLQSLGINPDQLKAALEVATTLDDLIAAL